MWTPAPSLPNVAASLIVSVYRDVDALRAIFQALLAQSTRQFEFVISEDGNDAAIAAFVSEAREKWPLVSHFSQPDSGFRKNRALNRAVLGARSDYLIFIDGDCVPHPHFVESHLRYAQPGVICSGRRIELGPQYSALLRSEPSRIAELASPLRYLALAMRMKRDGIKNYELGFPSPLLQKLLGGRDTSLVGCNFSCFRQDLLTINGFNEAYVSPGIGEDTDIEWRLRRVGVRVRNIKYLAVQYHLHHPRSYQVSDRNYRILAEEQSADRWYCEAGINQHQAIDQ